jgi:hypothetical protein
MSYFKPFLLLFLLGTTYLATAQTNKIALEISTPHGTITAGEPVPIRILITNISNKQIRLTENFTFTSNIYPNPVEQLSQGAQLIFNIEPNPMGGNIWVEDQVFIEELKSRTLKPGKSVELEYDLNKHFNDFISLDEPSILTGEYRVNLTYELRRRNGTNGIITGTLSSNELTLTVNK